MSISIQAMETMLDNAIWRTQQDEYSVAEIARLKAFVGKKMRNMLRMRFKIRGGAGMLRGNKVERIFGESNILLIGGGTAEVIKDLVAKQAGI